MAQDNLNQPSTDNKSIDETLDTTGLLLDYLANWKWFVISIVACLVGAYFYIATIVPTYQINASIYLNDDQSKNALAFNPDNPLIDMKSYID
ncbi:MAG: hypothetical protein ACI31C_06770, partial [Muribaculaceae bacterium]